jgi:hypothetical protein
MEYKLLSSKKYTATDNTVNEGSVQDGFLLHNNSD